jgi:hypothetical protein
VRSLGLALGLALLAALLLHHRTPAIRYDYGTPRATINQQEGGTR